MSHRDRLIEGALACLRDRGYARTTARDIVAASGTNLGSIGYHFGSKEALLNVALGHGFRDWTARIAAAAFADEDAAPLERLRAGWIEMLESFEDNRQLLSAFVEALAPASRSPELREQLAAQYRELREGVARMVAAALGGGAEAEDARAVASFLIAVCDGLVVQWLLDPEAPPSGELLVGALERAAKAVGGLPARA
jgi:AcrR family transcriptional regulator